MQHYGSDVLDAALLYMPAWASSRPTIRCGSQPCGPSTRNSSPTASSTATTRSASPDGLRGSEGTFTMCTFWYVDALARSGRLDDARLTFEKMLTYSNHLGLYAEEIAPTGEQIGNFPQAFSHLALINAAMNLDQLIPAPPAPCRVPPDLLVERDSLHR